MQTSSSSRQASSRLRHNGRCGQRVACWRPECADWAKAGYRTVEILPSGERIAYCHGTRWYPRPPFEAAA